MNEEKEINNNGKDIILNNVIECKSILKRQQKFNSNIEKRMQVPDKLNVETKALDTCEDGISKKKRIWLWEIQMLPGIRKHTMSYGRSLKFCYFQSARIADVTQCQHCSGLLLTKQPKCTNISYQMIPYTTWPKVLKFVIFCPLISQAFWQVK